MRRNVLFVLLLATGALLAEAQVKTGMQQEKPEAVPVKLESPQGQTGAAQGETEKATPAKETEQAEPGGAKEEAKKDAKVISGMSILGNQEAPKSLVIVPWKRSEIGSSMDVSTVLDDSRQPVDREVFMRALRYYEIRSKTEP
jgi:hypothetical protein